MEPFKAREKHGEEWHIQNLFCGFLDARDWMVERMIGNALQMGIPDLYLSHPEYGNRWVDIKVHGKYSYTKAQKLKWPVWAHFGSGVYILGAKNRKECTKAHMIQEYEILFGVPNWEDFWKPSYGKIDIDALLDQVRLDK